MGVYTRHKMLGAGLLNFCLMAAMAYKPMEYDGYGVARGHDDEDNEDAPVKVYMAGKYSDQYFVVCKKDVERVRKYTWCPWNKYPNNSKVGQLHHMIIGERPADIPEDWIVDHADGDELNAMRSNLRWVTRRFNTWNKKLTKSSSSKYRGVQFKRNAWRAVSLSCHLGKFDNERDAGMASAKHAIQVFGEWAMTSHVLLSNFTPLEIKDMKDAVDRGDIIQPRVKALPKGVTYHKRERKYYVRCFGVTVGTFRLVEDAINASDAYRQAKAQKEWDEHQRLPIIRDPLDDSAVIALSGSKGYGSFAKVPDEYWHALTFNSSWCLRLAPSPYAQAYWRGKSTTLHAAVWTLLHPEYKPRKGWSIDHVNPDLTLDNREHNLRLASKSNQERNKKRNSATSKYPGVSRRSDTGKYVAVVAIAGKTHRVETFTEAEAVREVNAMRLRLLGPDAPLVVFEDDEQ